MLRATGGIMSQDGNAAVLLSPIRTEAEARAWLLQLIDEVETTRRLIDVATDVRDQRRLYTRWMVFQGRSLGVLAALKRCGLLSDNGYHELRERVMTTSRPTIIPAGPTPGATIW